MSDGRKESLPRRSKEQTRELLLEAGVRLADRYFHDGDETALQAALSHIGFNDVIVEATALEAERHAIANPAPMSKGTAYAVFEDGQAGYRRELASRILASARTGDLEAVVTEYLEQVVPAESALHAHVADFAANLVAAAEELATTGEGARLFAVVDSYLELLNAAGAELPSVEEVVRTFTLRQLRRDLGHAAVFARYSFYVFASHPQIREALAKNYEDTMEGVLRFYEVLLRLYGRRVRPGVTLRGFAISLLALLDGFNLRHRIQDGQVLEDIDFRGERWSLFAYAAWGLVEAFTEPAPST